MNKSVDNIANEIKTIFLLGDFVIFKYDSHYPANEFLNSLTSSMILPYTLHPPKVTGHSKPYIKWSYLWKFNVYISDHLDWNLILKEEMCNTINLYYKYTSIPKSSFYKISIFIMPINTREKYLKYSIHFGSVCDYQSLWI